MKIRVDRDSVCIGDDVLPHETEFEIPEDMTVKEFFDFLEKERYLPVCSRKQCRLGTP